MWPGEPQQDAQQGSLQESSLLGMEQGCGVHTYPCLERCWGWESQWERPGGKSELKQASWDKPKGAEGSQGWHLCY